MTTAPLRGSPSLADQEYWWYRARASLLRQVLDPHLTALDRVLDVGSADGPSVDWLRSRAEHVALDMDPRGLVAGDVCGSALRLPFADGAFDVVAAFDVIEHCEPESAALAELHRVIRPGGHLMMTVPAYDWAWTRHDEDNGHHRRYTRGRARRAVERSGLVVLRSTHLFAGTFPFFALQRLGDRLVMDRRRAELAPEEVVPLPQVSERVDALLTWLCAVDGRVLARRDLPFGSSVVVVAQKVGGR